MSTSLPLDAGVRGRGACLVVGLGNPGDRYRGSRHNAGFAVVEALARRTGCRVGSLECNALTGRARQVELAMPQTYMNRSGHAVRCLIERRGVELDDMLVVYDDVSLPLGRLRLRKAGGPGGHRGMESVIQSVRSDAVPRLRIGVAPETLGADADLVEFVLQPFTRSEQPQVEEMVQRAADAVEAWIEFGIESAMNRFNAA